MTKLWSLIKVNDNLKLGSDFYSLAFYGFYLEDDEEDLSVVSSNISKVKTMIQIGQKTPLAPRLSASTRLSMTSEIQSPDFDDSGQKKALLNKIKKKWREERNLKNFYKAELIFGF